MFICCTESVVAVEDVFLEVISVLIVQQRDLIIRLGLGHGQTFSSGSQSLHTCELEIV